MVTCRPCPAHRAYAAPSESGAGVDAALCAVTAIISVVVPFAVGLRRWARARPAGSPLPSPGAGGRTYRPMIAFLIAGRAFTGRWSTALTSVGHL